MPISLDVKHLFISYIQAIFVNDPYLTWTLDPKTTKIIIGDKYFIQNPLIELKPSIIISRNQVRWGLHTINQNMDTASTTLLSKEDPKADLLHGAITINVMHLNESVAERVADYVFSHLSSHKDLLRREGLHKIHGLVMGEAIVVKGPTEKEIVNIPLTLNFAMFKQWKIVENIYNLRITTNLTGSQDTATLGTDLPEFGTGTLHEDLDYTITQPRTIEWINIPSGVEIAIDFIGNTTLYSRINTYNYTNGGPSTIELDEDILPWNTTLNGIIVYANTDTIDVGP